MSAPDAPDALAQAAALRAAGRREEAIRLLQRGLAGEQAEGIPAEAVPEARDLLGRLWLDAKQPIQAVAELSRAAALAPGRFHHLAHLATALTAAGRPADAERALLQAIRLAPEEAGLPFNLGTLRLQRGDPAAAIPALLQALHLDPGHAQAGLNLGTALREVGRLAEAEQILRQIAASPAVGAEARWNLALTLLQQERWAEGWGCYEARRRLSGFALDRLPIPAWTGGAVGRLLVYAEQGLGDTLQFHRFLPWLQGRAQAVTLRVQDALLPLLSGQPSSGVALIGRSAPLPEVDAAVPLLSLAGMLTSPPVGQAGWPPAPPYLDADPARRAQVRARLGRTAPLQIGLCWQGNRSYRLDRQRSLPPEALSALLAPGLPGCRWIALQQNEPLPEGAEAWPGLDADGAFLDSAALLMELDLLITSDTALAHLAGALGRPVWLLLANVPDWRWGLTGERTLWYPQARLFRQPRPGDWAAVIAEVRGRLAGQAAQEATDG